MIEDIEKLRRISIAKLDNAEALNHIGKLIDASEDAGFGRGADRALHLLNEISARDLSSKQGAIVEYFRSNAWSVRGNYALELAVAQATGS
jgi:hypothetical protein